MGRKTQQTPVPWDTRWKQIPGFLNYWISDHGHIFNMRLQILMEQYISNKGVRCVRLYRNNHRYSKSVAKLVRENFGEVYEHQTKKEQQIAETSGGDFLKNLRA